MARPFKYTKNVKKRLLKEFLAYIDETPIPIVAEFAYTHNISRQRLYEMPELSDAIKLCIAKKEANLEKFALANKINTTMAVFSLKQLGWTDKVDLDNRGQISVKVEFCE